MSRRCTSLAGDPSSGHRSIKILRFCGPPILGPCKGGVLRPVRHAQRIAPIHAKRHILADRWHLGIIRAEPLKSIVILGTPVCKAFQRPELALIGLIDHVITPLTTFVLPQNGHGSSFKSPTPLKYCVFIFYTLLCVVFLPSLVGLAGTICFVGRCTGSRWTYASAPAGWRPLLAMGARCESVPGL